MSEAAQSERSDKEMERPLRQIAMFFVGEEPNSLAARKNLRLLQEKCPGIRFEIEEVDVFKDYQRALDYGVLVTPCLVLVEPTPRVMIAGTLEDLERVRLALRLNRI